MLHQTQFGRKCVSPVFAEFCEATIMKGSDFIAHIEKYTKGAMGHIFAHYDRTHSSSTSCIDENRTHLNYNLAEKDQPLSQQDFIHKRLSEIKVLKRANVNVMCDWIVTAPKGMSPDELPRFFDESYIFLNNRYGKENVISAYVHMDETTPHVHYSFVPVVIDKKKGIPKLSAKERISKKDLQTFHKDLSAHMEKVFGRDIGILNDATIMGNKTIKQLRQISANLEAFKSAPIEEENSAVYKLLGKDKVVVRRSELERVNKAVEDSALIMSNTEVLNRQLSEKSKKADINYKKSEEAVSHAHKLAESIIADANNSASEISASIEADKTSWEQQKALQQAELDDRSAELDKRDRMQAHRAERQRQDEGRNDKNARKNEEYAAELKEERKALFEEKRKFYSIKNSPQEYYEIELSALRNINGELRSDIDKKDKTIQELCRHIRDKDAEHTAVIEKQEHDNELRIKSALENKEQELSARYLTLIESKDTEIDRQSKMIDKLRDCLDKAYRVIRDICMGIATLFCGKGKWEPYRVDFRDKPFSLIEAMMSAGEKAAEEAGFSEYAEEIRNNYGIYPLVKEELDIIDPPEPTRSYNSYER